MVSSIVGLLNNAALLLVAGFVFDLMGEYNLVRRPSFRQFITGLMLGMIVVGVMLTPWELYPGVIFDTRSVLLAVSGLFFGTLPTVIAMVAAVVARALIGGAGVLPGIGLSITSAGIGLLWRHLRWRNKTLSAIRMRELYLLGIVVHIVMIFWLLALPWPMPLDVIPLITPAVMLVLPVGTALLGWLLVGRLMRREAELGLAESERQLKLITDNLPAFVALVGLSELRYRFVNSKFVDAYKLPAEKIIGKHIKEIIGEENFKFAKPHIDTVTQGKSTSYENSFLTAGQKRWINVNYVPDVKESGDVDAFIVLGHDLTERRQVEEDLRNSERLLRTIAENYPNSYLSVINQDLTVGYTAGQEFSKQGLNPNDFVGLHITDVFGDQAGFVEEQYLRTFAGQESNFELFINGQYQRYSTVPFYDDRGNIPSILAVSENVTERVMAEQRVRDSEERYRMLFERSSDAIFLVNSATGRYLDANHAAERLTGYTLSELREKTLYDLTPLGAEKRISQIQKYDSLQTLDMGEVVYLRKDGSKRITLLHIVVISDELIFGLAHDITERKQANKEIRQANEKLQEQLLEIKKLESVLREQAIRDPLTGIFNRRYMEATFEQALSEADRKNEPLSVVLLDLDYLKKINERYGHVGGGDKALQTIANSISKLCRAEDVFCRYAGDEFVVVMSGIHADLAYKRALEWRDALSTQKVDNAFYISFSAGVAEFPVHGRSSSELLMHADQALFSAKRKGRNSIIIYDRDTTSQ